ncbi:hypothetical protein EDEG_03563 [Edhazardia aedis USNM 41457]|uniref:Uncharacterized protein n=1 Tax=Edhazardia aedis (strain USNM 41457) TaxID=1003232 RepID=J8ZQJ8_EDHAE|nr:hypothetical protein EDEG_03563 [Edhazardia aedis USNM 41457]|eukprot:EJW01983.1 hypothetical protein EDEG_03563 [Edhazardia aedis USNM 41457]
MMRGSERKEIAKFQDYVKAKDYFKVRKYLVKFNNDFKNKTSNEYREAFEKEIEILKIVMKNDIKLALANNYHIKYVMIEVLSALDEEFQETTRFCIVSSISKKYLDDFHSAVLDQTYFYSVNFINNCISFYENCLKSMDLAYSHFPKIFNIQGEFTFQYFVEIKKKLQHLIYNFKVEDEEVLQGMKILLSFEMKYSKKYFSTSCCNPKHNFNLSEKNLAKYEQLSFAKKMSNNMIGNKNFTSLNDKKNIYLNQKKDEISNNKNGFNDIFTNFNSHNLEENCQIYTDEDYGSANSAKIIDIRSADITDNFEKSSCDFVSDGNSTDSKQGILPKGNFIGDYFKNSGQNSYSKFINKSLEYFKSNIIDMEQSDLQLNISKEKILNKDLISKKPLQCVQNNHGHKEPRKINFKSFKQEYSNQKQNIKEEFNVNKIVINHENLLLGDDQLNYENDNNELITYKDEFFNSCISNKSNEISHDWKETNKDILCSIPQDDENEKACLYEKSDELYLKIEENHGLEDNNQDMPICEKSNINEVVKDTIPEEILIDKNLDSCHKEKENEDIKNNNNIILTDKQEDINLKSLNIHSLRSKMVKEDLKKFAIRNICEHRKMLSRIFIPYVDKYIKDITKILKKKQTALGKHEYKIYVAVTEFFNEIGDIFNKVKYFGESNALTSFIKETDQILAKLVATFPKSKEFIDSCVTLNTLVYTETTFNDLIERIVENNGQVHDNIQVYKDIRKIEAVEYHFLEDFVRSSLTINHLTPNPDFANQIFVFVRKNLHDNELLDINEEVLLYLVETIISHLFTQILSVKLNTTVANSLLDEFINLKMMLLEFIKKVPLSAIIENYLRIFLVEPVEIELFVTNFINFSNGIFSFSQILRIIDDSSNNVKLYLEYKKRLKSNTPTNI